MAEPVTTEELESVARAIIIARGAKVVASNANWPETVKHHREMCAKHPDSYPSSSSLITDAFRDARAAIEALANRKAGEWRPIAEAPKDGTTVLLCRDEPPEVHRWLGKFMPDKNVWRVIGASEKERDILESLWVPTLWAAIPALPARRELPPPPLPLTDAGG